MRRTLLIITLIAAITAICDANTSHLRKAFEQRALKHASAGNMFENSIKHLGAFQHQNGGFSPRKGAKPSLCTTSGALVLANMYGIRSGVDFDAAAQFIDSLRNEGGGYAPHVDEVPDIESTACALEAWTQLGVDMPYNSNMANYANSLFRGPLFASKADINYGTIHGTYYAFNILKKLEQLDEDKQSAVKEYLQLNMHDETATVSRAWLSDLADTVGIDVPDDWFVQTAAGGFDDGTGTPSLHATHLALNALEDSMENINFDTLQKYIQDSVSDFGSAIEAHRAIARMPMKYIAQRFTAKLGYGAYGRADIGDMDVVTGRHIRPILSLSSLDVEHCGAHVSVSITWPNKTIDTHVLTYDNAIHMYTIPSHINTAGILGTIKAVATVRSSPLSHAYFKFDVADSRLIGYNAQVTAKATRKNILVPPHEPITVGTEFDFVVKLTSVSDKDVTLTNRDITVHFSVIDAAGVTIDKQVVNVSNQRDLEFYWTLESGSIPKGDMTFKWAVLSRHVHTVVEKTYRFDIIMAATDIQITGGFNPSQKQYHLGDYIHTSIIPASLPDLKTPHYYPSNIRNINTIRTRRFVMDMSSPKGILVKRVTGVGEVNATGTSLYKFSVTLDPMIGLVGDLVMSFKFIDAHGTAHTLLPYDTTKNEVIEDMSALHMTVSAELALRSLKGIPSSLTDRVQLSYGSELHASFKVIDTITHNLVQSSDTGLVALGFQHMSSTGRIHTSSTVTASQADSSGVMKVFCTVSPNIVSMSNTWLIIAANTADGELVPIRLDEGQAKWRVDIGGDIAVDPSIHSTVGSGKSSFIVQFKLACDDVPLNDAVLLCDVVRNDNGERSIVMNNLPVAVDSGGSYVISFSLLSSETGHHVLQFYRDIDWKMKREETETKKHHKRFAQLAEMPLEPLFEIEIAHVASSAFGLEMRILVGVLVIFLIGVVLMK